MLKWKKKTGKGRLFTKSTFKWAFNRNMRLIERASNSKRAFNRSFTVSGNIQPYTRTEKYKRLPTKTSHFGKYDLLIDMKHKPNFL